MNERDRDLRNLTYRLFVELGRAPSAGEVAECAALERAEVEAGWRRLHDGHALVLNPAPSSCEWRTRSRLSRPPIAFAPPIAAGMPTAPGMRSASVRRWMSTAGSRRRAPIAASRSQSKCGTSGPTTRACSSIVPAAHWWDDTVFT
jgi:hypothetical protein